MVFHIIDNGLFIRIRYQKSIKKHNEKGIKKEYKKEGMVLSMLQESARPAVILHEVDGKEMALIPAGTYQMGSANDYSEEAPVHTVALQAFYIDKYPVTNAEYAKFILATGARTPQNPDWDAYPCYFTNYPDCPVVNVTWAEATAYAAWAGKRLPTEEEWEYAALGGGEGPYPWGGGRLTGGLANYADKSSEYPWRDFANNDGFAYVSPVGIYPPNGYGLYDMAGNVWEWCSDWYFAYDDHIHDTAPFSDGWGGSKVCRGGCYHSNAYDLRVTRRRRVMLPEPQAEQSASISPLKPQSSQVSMGKLKARYGMSRAMAASTMLRTASRFCITLPSSSSTTVDSFVYGSWIPPICQDLP